MSRMMTTKKDKNKKEIIIKASVLSISINPCPLVPFFIYCASIYDKFHVYFSHKALVGIVTRMLQIRDLQNRDNT